MGWEFKHDFHDLYLPRNRSGGGGYWFSHDDRASDTLSRLRSISKKTVILGIHRRGCTLPITYVIAASQALLLFPRGILPFNAVQCLWLQGDGFDDVSQYCHCAHLRIFSSQGPASAGWSKCFQITRPLAGSEESSVPFHPSIRHDPGFCLPPIHQKILWCGSCHQCRSSSGSSWHNYAGLVRGGRGTFHKAVHNLSGQLCRRIIGRPNFPVLSVFIFTSLYRAILNHQWKFLVDIPDSSDIER